MCEMSKKIVEKELRDFFCFSIYGRAQGPLFMQMRGLSIAPAFAVNFPDRYHGPESPAGVLMPVPINTLRKGRRADRLPSFRMWYSVGINSSSLFIPIGDGYLDGRH